MSITMACMLRKSCPFCMSNHTQTTAKQALDGFPIAVQAKRECKEALAKGSAVQQMLL